MSAVAMLMLLGGVWCYLEFFDDIMAFVAKFIEEPFNRLCNFFANCHERK